MRILALLTAILAADVAFSAEKVGPWTSICPNSTASEYCDQVRKYAYNRYGVPALREVRLGRIVGVAWKLKGALVGYAPAIPEAGIPDQLRLSPRNAFYYIIDDGHGEPFLRMAREIQPRAE